MAVGCNEKVRAERVFGRVTPAKGGRHTGVILIEGYKLRLEANVGTKLGRPLAQDRLQAVLRKGGPGTG
jgi:hypothetical protein